MTANDLAHQADITPSSLSRSERGLRMLAFDEAARIAKVLGMTPNDLQDRAADILQRGIAQEHANALQELADALAKGREAAATLSAMLKRSGQ